MHLEIPRKDGGRAEIPLRFCGRRVCFLDKAPLTAPIFRRYRDQGGARLITTSPKKVRLLLGLGATEPGIEKPRRYY